MSSSADRSVSALLLVDMQRDYLDLPQLEPAAGVVVAHARRLLEGFRAAGHPVIHVWTTVSRDQDRRMRHWRRRELWRCEQGTEGHLPAPGLEPRAEERIVHKTAFDPFADGTLDVLLEELAVERLVIAGIHLHACVREAALGAHARERLSEIWVIEDAVTSDDPVHAAATSRYLQERDVRFVSTAQALAELDGGSGADTASRRVVGGGLGDVREAGLRCRAAAARWRELEASARAGVLVRAADLLEPQAASLAAQMAGEIGKPVRFGELEALRAAEMLRAISRRCTEDAQVEAAGPAIVRRRSLGVVAVVTPWNNPVYIPLGKIAAALAYGNGVLWKPAPRAHAIAERVAGLLREAGLAESLLELVRGDRLEAQLVMSDPSVDAVTLTGSSLAGFAAHEICAGRRIPLQAELGGNNAALVWGEVDLEHAAREIAAGAFALAGQRCTANRRVVVQRAHRDRLLELLIGETAALEVGDPRSPATVVGPMVDVESRERFSEALRRSGLPCTVPHGDLGPDGPRPAAWQLPRIVCCEDPAHELVQRESFGPLLVVQGAEELEHAIELVNGVEQGLAAALFSGSPDVVEVFLEQAQAGILKLNRSTADADVDVPFGGWKNSCVGPPEHGSFDRDFYTRPQTVYR